MASPRVERLDWDSSFFGFEVGRLSHVGTAAKLADALADADASGVACSYLLVDGADPVALATAQDAGFRVVDLRVTLTSPLPDGSSAPPAGDITVATDRDHSWILDLATTRFDASRFSVDRHFRRDAAGRLFAAWTQRGFDDPTREVLAARDALGFVVCGQAGHAGVIELIAAADGSPPGTGRRLLGAAHARFLAAGHTAVEVVTQGVNVPAMRLYEGAGYRVSSAAYWLHRWA